MAGHARLISPAVADGAAVIVPVQGQGKPVLMIDARPKLQWTEDEVATALETQQKRAGVLVALVRDRLELTWSDIRRELNEAAGGQASARVMVLAHHAMRAHQALELQSLLAEVAAGEEAASAYNGLRNQSGMSVIATQALNKAYEAAREEGKAGLSPTRSLLARIGAGPAELPTQSLSGVGGDQVSGSLPLESAPFSESSEPK